jgi:hypothetical protein
VAITATSETRNQALTAAAVSTARPSLLADYAELFKARVSTMVINTLCDGFIRISIR